MHEFWEVTSFDNKEGQWAPLQFTVLVQNTSVETSTPYCCLTDLFRKNKTKLQENPKFVFFYHDTEINFKEMWAMIQPAESCISLRILNLTKL